VIGGVVIGGIVIGGDMCGGGVIIVVAFVDDEA